MIENHALLTIFFIFTGAAILATIAMFTRQTMLTAYLILGLVLGPVGFNLIDNSQEISEISQIGITFLLFLLGLDLPPAKLLKMIKPTALPTVLSCLIFALLAIPVGLFLQSGLIETIILAVALMFSSTIIGLKLLPTTVLHHKPTGEVIISILLLQDILAIIALFGLHMMSSGAESNDVSELLITLVSLPFLITLIYFAQRYVLMPLLHRFSKIREYVFLLMIGWCLGVAQLTEWVGLSHEMGAFIAGVFIALNPIALYVADSLKPLRDFFLIVFFVTLGGSIDPQTLQHIIIPSVVLAAAILILKPHVFRILFKGKDDAQQERSREVGIRLGQGSEFSLLIALLAYQFGLISPDIQHLIQITVLLTFIVSPYLIISRYPSPIALSDKLRRD